MISFAFDMAFNGLYFDNNYMDIYGWFLLFGVFYFERMWYMAGLGSIGLAYVFDYFESYCLY